MRIGGFEPSTSCLSSKRSKPTELNPHISTKRKHKACERTAKIDIFVIFPKYFSKSDKIFSHRSRIRLFPPRTELPGKPPSVIPQKCQTKHFRGLYPKRSSLHALSRFREKRIYPARTFENSTKTKLPRTPLSEIDDLNIHLFYKMFAGLKKKG